MKKFFLPIIFFFINFNIFAEETVVKEAAEKAVATTNHGVDGGQLFLVAIGIAALFTICFYAAHHGEKAHFPED